MVLSCLTCNSNASTGVVGLGGPLSLHHFGGFIIGLTCVELVEIGITIYWGLRRTVLVNGEKVDQYTHTVKDRAMIRISSGPAFANPTILLPPASPPSVEQPRTKRPHH